jgi:hypothetical protein
MTPGDLPAIAGNTGSEKVDQQKIEGQAVEFGGELADEALDRPPGDPAMACHQTAMTAMGRP